MKKTVIRLALAALAALAVVAVTTAGKKKEVLEFAEKTYNFGTVGESDPDVVHEYTFTNTADEPVAVLSVSTGCGCTRPEYPHAPVAAGAQGVIKITFKPKGQSGSISKDITVRYRAATARSSERTRLRLRGTVTPAQP